MPIRQRAKFHELLIYASLFVSVVALITANRGRSDCSPESKTEHGLNAAEDPVEVHFPLPSNEIPEHDNKDKANQPEVIVSVAKPPIDRWLSMTFSQPFQALPAPPYEMTYNGLHHVMSSKSRLSSVEKDIRARLLCDKVHLKFRDERAKTVLLERLFEDAGLDYHLYTTGWTGWATSLEPVLDIVMGNTIWDRRWQRFKQYEKQREECVADAFKRLAEKWQPDPSWLDSLNEQEDPVGAEAESSE